MGKAIIFLDIDGVLATHKQYMMNRTNFHHNHEWASDLDVPYPYDDKCVKVFNEILEKTDADIVLSSDWRIRWDLEQLDKIFKANNIIKSPFDVTENFPYSGIQLEKLLEYNDLYEDDDVLSGTKVYLKPTEQLGQKKIDSVQSLGTIFHKVEAKEGLYGIAQKYNVSVEQLKYWNKLSSENLQIGQQLIVSQ